MSGLLEGKRLLITGAGSGFGAETARRAVKEGARVIVVDLNAQSGQATADELNASKAGSAIFVTGDVTKRKDWENVRDEAVKAFGGVDSLVNNAGWSYRNKDTLTVTDEEFDRVFDINVKSIFHSVNVIAPIMIKEGKGGSIVNIGSISSVRPRPGLTWYAATKGAVATASKGLAIDLAPHNIRVNVIEPVVTATGLFSEFVNKPNNEESHKAMAFNIPLGRIGETKDIAEAVVWLSSDRADFITGIELAVDGGRAI